MLYRADIHHVPWPLQHAETAIEVNDMTQPYALTLSESPPLLHFAARLDVVVWSLERLLKPST